MPIIGWFVFLLLRGFVNMCNNALYSRFQLITGNLEWMKASFMYLRLDPLPLRVAIEIARNYSVFKSVFFFSSIKWKYAIAFNFFNFRGSGLLLILQFYNAWIFPILIIIVEKSEENPGIVYMHGCCRVILLIDLDII